MVRVSIFEELIGMDIAVNKTAKFVLNKFYESEAGKWVLSSPRQRMMQYDVYNDPENMGLRLEFFSYMTEEDAVEFIMRFK